MSFNATIQATLTANTAQFTRGLDNAQTKVSALEYQMREAEGLAIIGEKNVDKAVKEIERLQKEIAETIALQKQIGVDRDLAAGPGGVRNGADKSAQQSARELEAIFREQERLMAARRDRIFESAGADAQVKMIEAEIAALSSQQLTAEGHTVETLKRQLVIEEKIAQVKSMRKASAGASARGADVVNNARSAAMAAESRDRSDSEARSRAAYEKNNRPPPLPDAPAARGVVAQLQGIKKTFSSLGGGSLVAAFGIGALVNGFMSVIRKAQAARDAALQIGAAIDSNTARVAKLADAYDSLTGSFQKGAVAVLAPINTLTDRMARDLSIVMDLARNFKLPTMGNIKDSGARYDQIRKNEAAEASFEARLALTQEKAKKRQEADLALQEAQVDVLRARVAAAEAAVDTEGKIEIKTAEVAIAQEAVAREKAGTLEHAKAELALVDQQAELDELKLQREAEITAEKEKQLEAEERLAKQKEEANKKLADMLAKQQAAAAGVKEAQAAYAAALSDQSAASLSEITGGERGSRADQRRAEEVARLRDQARTARDQGRMSLIGGEAVSVADQLSSRANQIQSGIGSLNTAERDPLAGVTAQLVQANESLARISESLAIMEVEA